MNIYKKIRIFFTFLSLVISVVTSSDLPNEKKKYGSKRILRGENLEKSTTSVVNVEDYEGKNYSEGSCSVNDNYSTAEINSEINEESETVLPETKEHSRKNSRKKEENALNKRTTSRSRSKNLPQQSHKRKNEGKRDSSFLISSSIRQGKDLSMKDATRKSDSAIYIRKNKERSANKSKKKDEPNLPSSPTTLGVSNLFEDNPKMKDASSGAFRKNKELLSSKNKKKDEPNLPSSPTTLEVSNLIEDNPKVTDDGNFIRKSSRSNFSRKSNSMSNFPTLEKKEPPPKISKSNKDGGCLGNPSQSKNKEPSTKQTKKELISNLKKLSVTPLKIGTRRNDKLDDKIPATRITDNSVSSDEMTEHSLERSTDSERSDFSSFPRLNSRRFGRSQSILSDNSRYAQFRGHTPSQTSDTPSVSFPNFRKVPSYSSIENDNSAPRSSESNSFGTTKRENRSDNSSQSNGFSKSKRPLNATTQEDILIENAKKCLDGVPLDEIEPFFTLGDVDEEIKSRDSRRNFSEELSKQIEDVEGLPETFMEFVIKARKLSHGKSPSPVPSNILEYICSLVENNQLVTSCKPLEIVEESFKIYFLDGNQESVVECKSDRISLLQYVVSTGKPEQQSQQNKEVRTLVVYQTDETSFVIAYRCTRFECEAQERRITKTTFGAVVLAFVSFASKDGPLLLDFGSNNQKPVEEKQKMLVKYLEKSANYIEKLGCLK